ncbi:MAG TPA: hypothetical protein VGG87_03275, partial [Solirubrobacteraceae bacterium]
DGYHILSDWTGVPDLFSQMGPTLRRLIPGHSKEPSALSGKARVIVTLWVLIVVPVLLSMMVGAVLLLPRVGTSAWNGGHQIAAAIPHQLDDGQILDVLASLVRLLALCLPLLGSALVTQKIVRGMVAKGRSWSAGSRARSSLLMVASAALVALMVWAWWPSGQYRPIRANQNGTLGGLVTLVSSPASVARPSAAVAAPARVELAPGKHLAISMIPAGGATKRHPALFFISGGRGKPPVAVLSPSSPDPSQATGGTFTSPSTASSSTASAPASATAPSSTPAGGSSSPTAPVSATAFQFKLPPAPKPGDSQAVAVGSKDGGVKYTIAYSVVTVDNGSPVTDRNSAYAMASCNRCTTVAVSFQVVLIVGHTSVIAPINEAEALNVNCPACTTTALADQIVVTLTKLPSKALLATLNADLKQLGDLSALGAGGTPAAVAAEVAQVQSEIDQQLRQSGSMTNSNSTGSAGNTTTGSATSTSSGGSAPTAPGGSTQSSSTAAPVSSTPTPTSSTPAAAPTGSTTATTSSGTSTTATSSSTVTTGSAAAPASPSGG